MQQFPGFAEQLRRLAKGIITTMKSQSTLHQKSMQNRSLNLELDKLADEAYAPVLA
eukprot:COSAG01_NODE_54431_length_332_cov_0.652361_1_plen_55_part_10